MIIALMAALLHLNSAYGAIYPQGNDLVTGAPVAAPAAGTKAKVVLFLSSRCPCSAAHESVITKLFDQFSPRGVSFIAVNSNADETEAESKTHFSSVKFHFPVIRDVQARWANEFGALKTPHAFVLNDKDQIVFSGGVDDSKAALPGGKPYLAQALEAVLSGHTPDPSSVRAIGCVIARP